MSHREWFLNGNYLIIIVSVCIILPLAVMKQLGMFGFFSCPHILSFISHFLSCTFSQLWFFLILFYSLFFLIHITWFCFVHLTTGYLGYTSGFSLTCMVFFLISVSFGKDADPSARCWPPHKLCFLLCRWSTRNSTSRVPWMKSTATSRWTMSTLLLMVQTTSARPKCSPSTLRFRDFILIFFPVFLPQCVCVSVGSVTHWPLVCFGF